MRRRFAFTFRGRLRDEGHRLVSDILGPDSASSDCVPNTVEE
jgi:hypothetical protein